MTAEMSSPKALTRSISKVKLKLSSKFKSSTTIEHFHHPSNSSSPTNTTAIASNKYNTSNTVLSPQPERQAVQEQTLVSVKYSDFNAQQPSSSSSPSETAAPTLSDPASIVSTSAANNSYSVSSQPAETDDTLNSSPPVTLHEKCIEHTDLLPPAPITPAAVEQLEAQSARPSLTTGATDFSMETIPPPVLSPSSTVSATATRRKSSQISNLSLQQTEFLITSIEAKPLQRTTAAVQLNDVHAVADAMALSILDKVDGNSIKDWEI